MTPHGVEVRVEIDRSKPLDDVTRWQWRRVQPTGGVPYVWPSADAAELACRSYYPGLLRTEVRPIAAPGEVVNMR
jgi:hypothetical protein